MILEKVREESMGIRVLFCLTKIVLELKESNDVAKETAWLVQNHLLLSEFAFKKDIEDFSVIKNIFKDKNTS